MFILFPHVSLADYGVSYEHYLYTACSDGIPIMDDQCLTGQTNVYNSFTKLGREDAGNYATVNYYADLRNGRVGSAVYSVGGVSEEYPTRCTSTSRVQNASFWDYLTFTIPAGYYPDGVSVGLSGHFGGTVSSIVGAGARADAWVSFATATFSTGLQGEGVAEEGTLTFDEDIELDNQLLAAGSTLNSDREYTFKVLAGIYSGQTWSVFYNPGTGYVTGWGQNDLYNGLRILSINVPEGSGITWVSDSGVFLNYTTAVSDDYSQATTVSFCRITPTLSIPAPQSLSTCRIQGRSVFRYFPWMEN